ncbi:DUF2993 domain-containing protein [Spirulina sp. 06S082]|uniref:LmeA family phospholipid-binding protein n=1 Tax=Spirulina sp. 06S082 TaxID=3110248 RepID=UPI002B1F2C16|nr:DUF2993 domain-containing protein [Spirulina sp. 06S082]MEA5471607.1 DUF2993 domain-containing protein [Spirulina sp. 06S082]
MLLLDRKNFGEQAINKIATLALSSQLNEAQQLNVRVKTDPTLLSQGKLASLLIDGTGLVTRGDLRMQQMYLEMDEIAVSPFKALMGNIVLTQPTQGTAKFVLTEKDFDRALNRLQLRDRVSCQLSKNGELAILESQDRVILTAIPTIQGKGEKVTLEMRSLNASFPAKQVKILVGELENILNLRNFGMTGIALIIQKLELGNGYLTLNATATMTQFPAK